MKSILDEIKSKKRFYFAVLLAATLLFAWTFTGLISYKFNFLTSMLNGLFWLWTYIVALGISITIALVTRNPKKLLPSSITILTLLVFFIAMDKNIPHLFPILGCLVLLAWILIVATLTPPKKTVALTFFMLLLFSYFGSVWGNALMSKKMNIELEKAKATAQVVIDKIEFYYQENGKYPKDIEDTEITSEIVTLSYPFSQLNYYSGDPNEYLLNFAHPLTISAYWYYVPETKEWELD